MIKVPFPPHGTTPQIFWLYRKVDSSGVSGVGYVAVGVVLPTGQVVLEWIVGDHRSIEIHSNLENVIAIHGHGGNTVVVDILALPEEE
jgi:hypothetical protein